MTEQIAIDKDGLFRLIQELKELRKRLSENDLLTRYAAKIEAKLLDRILKDSGIGAYLDEIKSKNEKERLKEALAKSRERGDKE